MLKIAPGSFSRHIPEIADTAVNGQHRVTLTKSFFLCDREISAEDYLKFVDDDTFPATERANELEGWSSVLFLEKRGRRLVASRVYDLARGCPVLQLAEC